jgi:hypothetical protein
VTVYYYGFRVLTASDTLCTSAVHEPATLPATASAALHSPERDSKSSGSSSGSVSVARKLLGFLPTSSSSSSSSDTAGVQDETCAMPAGPLVLKHAANLPGVAPPGNYRMRLAASDVVTQQELMCVDVWFKVS